MSGLARAPRLGVDVGTARVGVSASDPDGILASAVETVPRDEHALARVATIAADRGASVIYVGQPRSLAGRDTASTADADGFAEALASQVAIPVRMVDERLTTVSAQGQLRASGRKASRSRDVVDQIAAVIILQHALDRERTLNAPAGALVDRSADREQPDSTTTT